MWLETSLARNREISYQFLDLYKHRLGLLRWQEVIKSALKIIPDIKKKGTASNNIKALMGFRNHTESLSRAGNLKWQSQKCANVKWLRNVIGIAVKSCLLHNNDLFSHTMARLTSTTAKASISLGSAWSLPKRWYNTKDLEAKGQDYISWYHQELDSSNSINEPYLRKSKTIICMTSLPHLLLLSLWDVVLLLSHRYCRVCFSRKCEVLWYKRHRPSRIGVRSTTTESRSRIRWNLTLTISLGFYRFLRSRVWSVGCVRWRIIGTLSSCFEDVESRKATNLWNYCCPVVSSLWTRARAVRHSPHQGVRE